MIAIFHGLSQSFLGLMILFLVLIQSNLCAQGGETGLAFLKLGVGGRNVGMGDIGVVSSQGGAALHYNSANILMNSSAQIFVMHNSWFQDVTTDYLAATVPFGSWGIGFHLNTTTVPKIEIRTKPGEREGTFDARDLSTGISFAVTLSEDLSAGVTAKYILEKLYTEFVDGYAFDFGARYQFSESNLAAAIAVSNLGSMGELRNESVTLPALIRVGASYVIPVSAINGHVLVEANGVDVFKEKKIHAHIGAEADYENSLFLRVGYQSGFDVKGISAGLGAVYAQFRFDYGFTPFQNDFGSSHTISLSYQF